MLAAVLLALAADPAAPTLVGDPPTAVEAALAAKPADLAAALTVRLADAAADAPPLLGTHTFADGKLRFTPRFPFAAGVRYRATLSVNGSAASTEFTVPKPKAEPPAVLGVWPSGDRVPENALRFYVRFSKPMARGEVYPFVRLVNETDKRPVELPFLELDEELWSPDRTRLTLLVDPGRIKREVKPREDLGPALEAGKRFALEIAKGVPDADGLALKETFRHRYAATAADRTPIDPAEWTVTPPAGTRPLRIAFDKPLDAGTAQRLIAVADADGKPVAGAVTLSEHEKVWAFAPAAPWAAGRYAVVIDTRLEDVCGNRVGEPFEADLRNPVRPERPKSVRRAFEVR